MNKKGFTLIEIIIVIVILGVLATLSMPKITGQIEGSKAAEAMMMLGSLKRAAEQCYDTTQDVTSCKTFSALGVTQPTAGLFTYKSSTSGTTDVFFQAERPINGVPNFLCMSFNGSTGATRFQALPASSPYMGVVARTGSSSVVTNCGAAGMALMP